MCCLWDSSGVIFSFACPFEDHACDPQERLTLSSVVGDTQDLEVEVERGRSCPKILPSSPLPSSFLTSPSPSCPPGEQGPSGDVMQISGPGVLHCTIARLYFWFQLRVRGRKNPALTGGLCFLVPRAASPPLASVRTLPGRSCRQFSTST
ncbi:hypothetical protein E2C01_010679 [Portunus trituberculatus]|uniref:Uncharacterized protein n=1 Tax=Portunus trituberculatus TaxID=210409 RepID=A0A5B7D9A4_PORTR|nr:hypothetical protein [Portunus trituberculatus]